MPFFKGLQVQIHTNDGPLPEYSIQRQSKFSRITSYIAVPPPKIPPNSTTNKPEQSTFAISITLLTPDMPVHDQNGDTSIYTPGSTSHNETVAAYIYFDGRAKEEVATLLRRGEETWVNSRWVSVPEEEGGGLAEREFLFREVGLERYLNSLDLDSKDAAAKVERRKARSERRRRRRKEAEMELEASESQSPGSQVKVESDMELSESSDDDEDPPLPEAAGQIKVALFRVLASGEIKRGEYSPQFGAHEDDEESGAGSGSGGAEPADIDHTTSFAKPKALDPKSISTQTVTGIDGPENPYAVFTFLYRGERQLQKMGILPTRDGPDKPTSAAGKRRSVPTDFSKLGPLRSGGTVGFSTFRDNDSTLSSATYGGKKKKMSPSKDAESEDDDDADSVIADKADDPDVKAEKDGHLTVEDAQRQRELAEGVRQIKLKRQHSAEPESDFSARRSPTKPDTSTPPDSTTASTPPGFGGVNSVNSPQMPPINVEENVIGSPMKRSRPSLPGMDEEGLHKRLGLGFGTDILAEIAAKGSGPSPDVVSSSPKEVKTEVKNDEQST